MGTSLHVAIGLHGPPAAYGAAISRIRFPFASGVGFGIVRAVEALDRVVCTSETLRHF